MNSVEPIRSKKLIKKMEKFLKSRSERNLLLFIFGTNSGLRISDILNLKIEDVKDKTHIELNEKKTGKKKKFPLNSKLKNMINSFIVNKENKEPLFMSKKKKPMSRIQAYYIINDAARYVGIKDKIGTHTLRKTFGYHHYQKFKDIAILQTIFNHSNPAVTLRYIGINQDIIDKSYGNFEL